MPKPATIEKAYLQVITWDNNGRVNSEGKKTFVQFNPESLKVNFSNQIAGQDNNGGSAIQFNSRGTTKLTFDLWFDVSADPGQASPHKDVRQYTKELVGFMQEQRSRDGRSTLTPPPGCRFHWGTFLFEGIVDSINENLEYFSEQGVPLRASLAVSITKQELNIVINDQNARAANRDAVGTRPQQQTKAGDTFQNLAAKQGNPANWQQQALAVDIEDPLRLPEGTLIPQVPTAPALSGNLVRNSPVPSQPFQRNPFR